MSTQDNPLLGAQYLLRGLRMLLLPGLRRYLAIPLLINVLVFSGAIWLGIDQFQLLLDRFLPQSEWLVWLRWLLWPLFALTILLLTFYGFTLVANFIAAPFNGLLAERVEEMLTGHPPSDPGGGLLADLIPSLLSELGKFVYFVVRAIPLLLLFLIPGVNLIAPILWFLFSAWYLALQYADFALSNSGLRFRQQYGLLKRRRFTCIGFGLALTGLMMVPLLNFLAMPAAVVAATLLWVEQRDGLLAPR